MGGLAARCSFLAPSRRIETTKTEITDKVHDDMSLKSRFIPWEPRKIHRLHVRAPEMTPVVDTLPFSMLNRMRFSQLAIFPFNCASRLNHGTIRETIGRVRKHGPGMARESDSSSLACLRDSDIISCQPYHQWTQPQYLE